MWTYRQSTGELLRDGQLVATGYSGHDEGRNNPEMEAARNIGPIPRGRWLIVAHYDSETHGPVTMRLAPRSGTDTHGRDGFLIHGDSFRAPGTASHGCIILPRPARLEIVRSKDTEIEVIR